jgi:hypothetical protein
VYIYISSYISSFMVFSTHHFLTLCFHCVFIGYNLTRCTFSYQTLDLKKIDCKDVNWIQVAQIRVHWWILVNMVMNLGVRKETCYLLTSWTTWSLYMNTLHRGNSLLSYEHCLKGRTWRLGLGLYYYWVPRFTWSYAIQWDLMSHKATSPAVYYDGESRVTAGWTADVCATYSELCTRRDEA